MTQVVRLENNNLNHNNDNDNDIEQSIMHNERKLEVC